MCAKTPAVFSVRSNVLESRGDSYSRRIYNQIINLRSLLANLHDIFRRENREKAAENQKWRFQQGDI